MKKCPKCKEKKFIVSVFGSICDNCLFEPKGDLPNPECFSCGKKMIEVWDKIAKKYTGHLWKCKCIPKEMVLSIG